MSVRTLADVGVGDTAVVVGVSGEPALCARLLDLGFVSGTYVRVLFSSRGTMRVRIRGCDMSLRLSTAAMINVYETRHVYETDKR